VSILVCDDHPLVRSALAMAAGAACPGEFVSTARDFPDAWARAETEQPRLCIVDLHMPGAGPLEGLKGVQDRAPDAKIVVVTGSELDAELLAVMRLGVDGFVPKAAETAIFTAALSLVLAGGRYLPPRLLELAEKQPPLAAVEAPLGRLSGRQGDVLRLMAEGRANKEIARELGVSPATVKTHVAQVIAVMGAANRTEAVARARESGLI